MRDPARGQACMQTAAHLQGPPRHASAWPDMRNQVCMKVKRG